MCITFTIPGKPFGKQRPRATRQGRMYTPAETVAFEAIVRQIAVEHFANPMAGPVKVEVIAVFIPAKSWSQKKQAAHLGRPHTQKPDLDNCMKAVLDGLNRIAFADDSQVAEFTARKAWGHVEETRVIVEAL